MRTGSKLPASELPAAVRGACRAAADGEAAAPGPVRPGRARCGAGADTRLGRCLTAPGATFVFAAELLFDLVDDLDAARVDAGVDRRQLGRLRFELRERRQRSHGGTLPRSLTRASTRR